MSLCDAAMAGNTEEVFRNEHNLLFFTRLVLSLSPFTVIIIFFTRFMLLIHSEQMTPLTLQLQVLIRLNMGEDVNQKHYPRSERLPGIHYYDITLHFAALSKGRIQLNVCFHFLEMGLTRQISPILRGR